MPWAGPAHIPTVPQITVFFLPALSFNPSPSMQTFSLSVSSRKYFHIPGCRRKQLFHPLCLDKWAVQFNSFSATQHTQPSLPECGKDLLCSVLREDDGPDSYFLKEACNPLLTVSMYTTFVTTSKHFLWVRFLFFFFSLKHRDFDRPQQEGKEQFVTKIHQGVLQKCIVR